MVATQHNGRQEPRITAVSSRSEVRSRSPLMGRLTSREAVDYSTLNCSCWMGLPGAVLAGVALGQLVDEGLVEGHQGARADLLAGGLADDGAPVAGGAQLEDPAQELAHLGAAGVVAGADVLLEDLAADVIVQLELDQ